MQARPVDALYVLRTIFGGWRLGAFVSVVLVIWLRAKELARGFERRRKLASLRFLRSNRNSEKVVQLPE
jgi:hypothetical protein